MTIATDNVMHTNVNQIKSLLLSHHHSTCALMSEILQCEILQCNSTHSVLLDILTVINTHYSQYVHILHHVHIYTYTVMCNGAVDCT